MNGRTCSPNPHKRRNTTTTIPTLVLLFFIACWRVATALFDDVTPVFRPEWSPCKAMTSSTTLASSAFTTSRSRERMRFMSFSETSSFWRVETKVFMLLIRSTKPSNAFCHYLAAPAFPGSVFGRSFSTRTASSPQAVAVKTSYFFASANCREGLQTNIRQW